MADNRIRRFADEADEASVLNDEDYENDPQRSIGHQPGIARSELENKALRQSTAMSASLAQVVAEEQEYDVEDSKTTNTLSGYIKEAVRSIFRKFLARNGGTVPETDRQNDFAENQKIAGKTVWHAGNDGPNSGLDADTVDGQHASDFATAVQGSRADSAVQPEDIGTAATYDTGKTSGLVAEDSAHADDADTVDGYPVQSGLYATDPAVMRVGAFGLGGSATYATGADADTLTTSGYYYGKGSNWPYSSDTNQYMIVVPSQSGGVTQIAWRYGDTANWWVRDNTVGGFSDWERPNANNADTVDGYHASDFATASQGDRADSALQPSNRYSQGGTLAETDRANDWSEAQTFYRVVLSEGVYIDRFGNMYLPDNAPTFNIFGPETSRILECSLEVFRYNGSPIWHEGNTGKNSGLVAEDSAHADNADNADTVDGKHASDFATAAQGEKADSAVQPLDLFSDVYDRTSIRNTETTYSNYTGKPMMVNVSTSSGRSSRWMNMFIGGTLVAQSSVSDRDSDGRDVAANVSTIIPAGSSYRVEASDIGTWVEIF